MSLDNDDELNARELMQEVKDVEYGDLIAHAIRKTRMAGDELHITYRPGPKSVLKILITSGGPR
jgi:hypothetical protein